MLSLQYKEVAKTYRAARGACGGNVEFKGAVGLGTDVSTSWVVVVVLAEVVLAAVVVGSKRDVVVVSRGTMMAPETPLTARKPTWAMFVTRMAFRILASSTTSAQAGASGNALRMLVVGEDNPARREKFRRNMIPATFITPRDHVNDVCKCGRK